MRAGRLGCVLVAALTAAWVLAGPGIGAAAGGSQAGRGAAGTGPGSVLWTSVRAGDGHAVAADPRGGTVFAAGSTGLVAYDAVTGAKLWDNSQGSGRSVAVSPDGRAVFVIKPVRTSGGTWDFATAAFDAGTGRQLWARRYNGRANGDNRPIALAVSPGGGAVFVTGTSQGRTSGRDFATVAYAAATGRRLWVSRYSGPGRGPDTAAAIAVSPHGGDVFVTGTSSESKTSSGFATVAYAAATGAALWTKRYDRAGASSVAVSPDGRRVFVTGISVPRGSRLHDIATVAYAAATGAPLWVRRYHGSADRQDSSVAVLVSPLGGGTVVVAGDSQGPADYLSVAYSAATGTTQWVRHFSGFGQESLHAAAISPDGRSLYLTGIAFVVPGGEQPGEAVTVAARIATGAQSWATVVPPAANTDAGISVAVLPENGTVYAVVENYTATAPHDFTTVAFRG